MASAADARRTTNRLLAVFLLLAILYTAHITAPLLIPFAFAILLSMLLIPLVRWMHVHLRIPSPLGAALVLVSLVGLIIGSAYLLAEPAANWLKKAPANIQQLERRMGEVSGPVEQVKETSRNVEELTKLDEDEDSMEVTVKKPGMLDRVFSSLPAMLGSTAIMLATLYFLLATGDRLMERIAFALRSRTQRKWAVSTMREVEGSISRFLRTITFINIGVALVVSLMLYLVGVPNPLLWGALAGLLNFAPYVGAMVTFALIAVVSFSTFDSVGMALLPPLLFLAITGLEGLLITPMILGRDLALNPLIIFIAIIGWGWIWGIAGALMAVPLLVSIKICLSRIPATRPAARIIGRGGLSTHASTSPADSGQPDDSGDSDGADSGNQSPT